MYYTINPECGRFLKTATRSKTPQHDHRPFSKSKKKKKRTIKQKESERMFVEEKELPSILKEVDWKTNRRNACAS